MNWKICVMVAPALLFAACSEHEFKIKESEVPPNVLAAFKAKYPSAEVKEWEAEKEDGKFYFEVDFKEGGKEKEARITPDGNSVEEEK